MRSMVKFRWHDRISVKNIVFILIWIQAGSGGPIDRDSQRIVIKQQSDHAPDRNDNRLETITVNLLPGEAVPSAIDPLTNINLTTTTGTNCETGVSCPCNDPKLNDCAVDAICIVEQGQPSGYTCKCKDGFIDVFYTDPPLPGRICVRSLQANVNDAANAAIVNLNSGGNLKDSFTKPQSQPDTNSFTQSELREIFDDMDRDKNGSISLEELKIYVRRLNNDNFLRKFTNAQMARMIELADQNGNGMVEWTEFIRLFSNDNFFRRKFNFRRT